MVTPPEAPMTASTFRSPALAALGLAGLLALSGCGRDPGGAAPEASGPQAPGIAEADAGEGAFERTWLGVLPCADCDGIETRLQLSQGPGGARYLLEETYLGGPGENRFVQEGDWREDGDGHRRRTGRGLPAGPPAARAAGSGCSPTAAWKCSRPRPAPRPMASPTACSDC